MNLNELRKGLGNENLTQEDLDEFQSLYLLDQNLTKNEFFALVLSIGTDAAKRLSRCITDLWNKSNALDRLARESKAQIEKLQEETDVNRTVKEALAEKYKETDARYVQLLEKHGEFLRFLKNCPEIETMYLDYKRKEAEKLFDFMTSPEF